MASVELDEHNFSYNERENARIWNNALRKAGSNRRVALRSVITSNYRGLIATHNIDGDGLTRPRKHRRA
jgi:hypothetical protein